jgi:hypothetical protein
MSNRVVGDSERDDGKPKKREGLWKLKSEPVPNRTSESASSGASPTWMSCVGVGKVRSHELLPQWSAQARVGSAWEWVTLGERRASVAPSLASPGVSDGDGSSGASGRGRILPHRYVGGMSCYRR